MGKKGHPYLPNIEPIVAMGINPKTGLPVKISDSCSLKEDIKKLLRIKDEQTAVNRYKWTNLPDNFKLTSQEIERLLYYKGQLCLFYLEDNNEFMLLPFALDGTIDVYGRFNTIHPIPMSEGKEANQNTPAALLLSNKKYDVVYKLDPNEKYDKNKNCVILHDYTKQVSQSIISRQILQDPILDVMSEMIPLARTAAILGSGVQGLRTDSAATADEVKTAATLMEDAAMTGKPWIPLNQAVEFQELAPAGVNKTSEYLLTLQSLDNFRLSMYGLGEGVYEKKAHTLESEQEMNKGPNDLVSDDGLLIRQNAIEIFNKIAGTNIMVEKVEIEPEETVEDDEGGNDDANDSTVQNEATV